MFRALGSFPSTHWRDEILRIAARHGAHNVRVFGSVARGEAGPESDIDLLVDIGSRTSAWFPIGLIDDLEQLLGRKVDVLTDGGVQPLSSGAHLSRGCSSVKDDRVYLWHIRDCIDRILDYTKDGEGAFLADTKTQDAVIRNLEIIP